MEKIAENFYYKELMENYTLLHSYEQEWGPDTNIWKHAWTNTWKKMNLLPNIEASQQGRQ